MKYKLFLKMEILKSFTISMRIFSVILRNASQCRRQCILVGETQVKSYFQSPTLIDLSPFEWNFDLDKSGQKFQHSLKEHHKISNIQKFRCEML
jgi:hypothetical protein